MILTQARRVLNETLKRLIEKRRESHGDQISDGLLGVLLESTSDQDKVKSQLSDSQIADNIIGVIFAAHDTTASAITWTLKYLHDNPHILEAVTVYIYTYIFSFYF